MAQSDPISTALSHLEAAARRAGLDPDVLSILRLPKETLKARLVIRMDDGSRRAFPAWRCRYDDSLGPTKGGIRFHPAVTGEEVESLAFWMTIKCAIAGLPFGGGKGGVTVDPDALSLAELERLSRAYVRAFFAIIGPDRDIPAPDVGTNAMVMAWMADEYAVLAGRRAPGAFTGKPVAMHGSQGRDGATGLGGFLLLSHLRDRLGIKSGARVAIQGLGKVGLSLAEQFARDGARVVAAADSKATLLADQGLDIAALAKAKRADEPIEGLADGASVIAADPGAVLSADCDILAPCALEDALTGKTAGQVRARVVLEMANGPTSPEGDEVLARRGVTVVPDVLANAGGVIVSYFEWLQNRQGVTWDLEAVRKGLGQRMEATGDAVFALAEQEETGLREAAYAYGLRRLGSAIAAQGVARDFAPAKKSSLPGD